MKLPKINITRGQITSWFLLFSFFTLLTLFFYNGIEKIYFQQDEWFKTGKSIYYLHTDFGSLWTKRFGFHYYPLLNLYFIGEYLLFRMNVPLYMYVSLFLQGVAGVFAYVFFKKVFENKVAAFLLTLLFLINPGIHQVNLNEMVASSYKIPLILMLSSFIFLFDSIQKSGKLGYNKLITLAVIYVISVAFFEGALVMIVLIPLFFALFKSKNVSFEFNQKNISVLSFLFILTVVRLAAQNILPVDAPLPIEGSFIVSTLYNAGTTPFKFIAEYILNLENIYSLGRIYEQKIFVLKNNPNVDHGTVAVTTGYEIVVYFFVSVMAIISAFAIGLADKKSGKVRKYLLIILFAVVWLVVNSVVISPQGRIFNALESRYLYISGIGVLMIIGSLALLLWETFKKYNWFKIVFFVSLFTYLVYASSYSYKVIGQEREILMGRSIARQKFVSQFKKLYPKLADRAIIYIYCIDDCTSNERVGMRREWVVPFQNGVGWVLLIMYTPDNPQRYSPYFSNYLFWDNKAAGYREIGNTSFGFFTNLGELKKTMKKYSLTPSDITVVQYESKKFKLIPAKNTEKILSP